MDKKRAVYACGCSCCVLLLAVVGFAGFLFFTVKSPDVSVKYVTLQNIAANGATATMTMNLHMKGGNPNGWPLKEITLEKMKVEVYSVDKQSKDAKQPFYLGTASLPVSVTLTNTSVTDFLLTINASSSSDTAVPLTARLVRDCGPVARPKETELMLKIKEMNVKAALSLKAPSDFEITTTAECNVAAMAASGAASVPNSAINSAANLLSATTAAASSTGVTTTIRASSSGAVPVTNKLPGAALVELRSRGLKRLRSLADLAPSA